MHEQKLNFVRAQITELNRRMTALISTSERGFPTHENMHIRNPVVPQPALLTDGNSRGSTPQAEMASSMAQLLQKQNQKLVEVKFVFFMKNFG